MTTDLVIDALTHVDFTTVYGAVIALTEPRRRLWAETSLSDLGSLVLLDSNVRIPPPPSELRQPGGLLTDLMGLATRRWFRKDHKQEASSSLRSVISDPRALGTIQTELARLMEEPECVHWRAWHIDHEWPEHIKRIKGVIEPRHLEDVATVATVPEVELSELNREALADPEGFSSRACEVAQRAYTADVLVRGVYYDELARRSRHQIVHHSVRRGLLPAGDPSADSGIAIPREVAYLLKIITGEARMLKQSSHKVKAWVDHLRTCREYLRTTPHQFDGDISDQEAISLAAEMAWKSSVSGSFKAARRRLDAEVELCAHLAALLVLSPFVGELGALLISTAGRRLIQVPVLRASGKEERWHYRRLAKKGPGRVLTTVRVRRPEPRR